MIKSLDNRVRKTDDLEMEIYTIKEAYKSLENTLSKGFKAVKQQRDSLELNLERIVNEFKAETYKKDKFAIELAATEKKLQKECEKARKYEEEIKKYQENQIEYEKRIQIAEEEQSQSFVSRNRISVCGNTKKVMKGGINKYVRFSTVLSRVPDM